MNNENSVQSLNCEKCGESHNGTYGSGRFCSAACARGFSTKSKRKEINKKVSKTLRKSLLKKIFVFDCVICGKEKKVKWSKRKQKTCSLSCGTKWRVHPDNPNAENMRNILREAGKNSARIQNKTRRSKNEIMFFNLCKKKWPSSLPNEPMFNGWDADVVIPKLKVAVAWNGAWHYKKITEEYNLKRVKIRDAIKQKEIKKAGYTLYVIKDMGKHNPSFVNKQFKEFVSWVNNF